MFVCEPDEVRARAEKSLAQLAGSWRDATARGAAVPEPAKLFVPLDDVTALCDLGTRIEELGIEEAGALDAETGKPASRRGQAGSRKPRAAPRPCSGRP